MKRQERFLSQRDLAVDQARVAFQKPVQASIQIHLISQPSFWRVSDTDTLKTKGIDKLL